MMQTETMTATRQSVGVRSRAAPLTGAGRMRGGLVSRSGSANAQESMNLRATLGSNPREFMRRQQQPNGE